MEHEIKELKGFVAEQISAKITEHTNAIKAGNDSLAADIKSQLADIAAQNIQRIDAIDAEVQKVKSNGGGAGQGLVTIANFIETRLRGDDAHKFNAFRTTKAGGFGIDLEHKVAGTMTFANSTTGQVVNNVYLPGIVADVYRKNRIRGLLPIGTMLGDKVPFVAQTGKDGAAAVTSEGATKGQVDQDLTLREAPARKITAFQVVSEEMLEDIPALSSFIGYTLLNNLADVEDAQLLYGDGTAPNLTGLTVGAQDADDISGFLTSSANSWDAIMAAKAHLASLNYTADIVAMNPVDLYAMAAVKGDNGQYVAPIFWTQGVPTLWGQPVYMTTAITAGNLLVMDGTRAAQLFQRTPMSIRFYDQDSTNARQNLVTIVGEERLALPKYYADAVFYDSFENVIEAITPVAP